MSTSALCPDTSSPIKAACRTPISFFERLRQLCNYTEAKCFGLILCQTIGSSQRWREITWREFETAANVTRESCQSAISSLENAHLISTRPLGKGRLEYAVSESMQKEADEAGSSIKGKCPDCHRVGSFALKFVAVPHAAFRKLGAAVDHATYCVVMTIIRNTLHWNGSRGVWSESCELEINDIERDTGFSRKSISNALSSAVKLGLIRRTDRPGRNSVYEALPEGFARLESRAARVVEMPDRGKENGKTPPEESLKKAEKPKEPKVKESEPKIYGQCPHCGHFVTPEPVSEAEMQPEPQQKEPGRIPRPGPKVETGRKKSKTEAIFDELRKRFA